MRQPDKDWSIILARLTLGLAFVALSRAFFALGQTGGAVEESARGVGQASLALTIVANLWVVPTLVLAAVQLRARAFQLVLAALLPALVAHFLAVLLSDAPAFGIKEFVRLALTALAAAVVGSILSPAQIVSDLARITLLICLCSVVTALALPRYGQGVGVHAGAWQGVFPHKNHLGRFAALALLLQLVRRATQPTGFGRLEVQLGIAVATGLVLMSKSVNAYWLVTLVFSAFVGLSAWKRLDGAVAKFSFLYLLAGGALLVLMAGYLWIGGIEGLLLRTSNLSGRWTIWSVALQGSWERPWLGFGLATFWPTHPTVVARMDDYIVPHAHNGFLDALLAAGWLGALATTLTGFLLWNLSRHHSRRRSASPEPASAVGPILAFFVGVNLLESVLLSANIYLFCALVIVSAKVKVRQRG